MSSVLGKRDIDWIDEDFIDDEDLKVVKKPTREKVTGTIVPKKCQHLLYIARCKICTPGENCEHLIQKYICKRCGGKSICEHNRVKYQCKACDGISFCEHKRQKTKCKECNSDNV